LKLPSRAFSEGYGVIDMALLSVIRRGHFREHLSIREICRRTGLSRNTIRKYLRADDVEPKFKVPERPSKLDPFADRLSAWLKTESKKSRKQKRTMKQLHADLVSLGYEGSYIRVAAFAREWREDRQRELQTTGRGTFVPLAFEPGEAFQFDWSEDWAIIGNERTKLQVAQTKLSYSRAFIVRAYLLQTHEMLFDAHNHAFRVFGGVPGRGIYDNMKTAIDKVGRGKERDVNIRFQAMASHYLFEPKLLLRRPMPLTRRPSDQFDPLIVIRHMPVLKDILEPSCLRRLSGRNGGQFRDQRGARMPTPSLRVPR
jgi:transposase